MKRSTAGILVFIFIQTLLNGQGVKEGAYISATSLLDHSSSFFDSTYLQNDLNQFLDNYVDDVHVHLETTASWNQIDPYLFAFTGSSYKWTKHYYDGIQINNVLNAGDAMFHFPLINNDLNIDRVAGTIHLQPQSYQKKRVDAQIIRGNIGDRVGYTDWFLNNVSGHNSATQRSLFEIKDRPYMGGHLNIHGYHTFQKDSSTYPLQYHLIAGERLHIDQNYIGESTSYDESYVDLLTTVSISNTKNIIGNGLHVITHLQHRNNNFAEFQYAAGETAAKTAWHTTIYTTKNTDSLSQSMGLSLAIENLKKNDLSWSRNILDQDGEGLYPYFADGSRWAITHYYRRSNKKNLFVVRKNTNRNSPWFYEIETNNNWVYHRPQNSSFSTPIYSQSTPEDVTALHVINWHSQSFAAALLDNKALYGFHQKGESYQIKAYAGLQFSGLILKNKSVLDIIPAFDIGLEKTFGDWLFTGLRAGVLPHRFDIDQLRYLSNDYLNGEAYFWNDNNQNLLADQNETGQLAFTTGGQYRQKGEELGMARTYYLEIPLTLRPFRQFQINVLPQYRQFRGTWVTDYDQQNGSNVDYNDREYFFRNPGPSSYIIDTYQDDRMKDDPDENRHWLTSRPFYAGTTIRFQYQSGKLLVALSGTANMVVSSSPMGNGPLHNNINALSETTADPNLRENRVGRLDTDRSYIARFLMSYRYSTNGTFALQLKYRDGQNFAFYDHVIRSIDAGNQIGFYQPRPRGDNPFTGLMGRREDFFTNLELRWQHLFKVGDGQLRCRLSLYNLSDFANETSEYTFGYQGDFTRSPLELQVKRSFSVWVGYEW